MKNKLYHFLILLVLLPLFSLSQPINTLVGDNQLAPPTIASIARYSDIPVSFFTGVPNISIPIYQVEEGTISLPLSMRYHSSGVKVAETASWTGLGWSLMAGGVVSRTTQGIPDDKSSEGYFWGGAPYDPCQVNANPDSVRMTLQGAKDGALDAEPDIFHFNFAGYSGKFFFDPNGVPVLVPNQDIVIEPITGDVPSQIFDGIRGWKFTTPNGTQYYFGGYDNTPTADLVVDEIQINGNRELSTWYLINLRSYDSEYEINLSYVDEAYSYRSPATCQQVIAECANQNGNAAGIEFRCLGFNGTSSFHINRVDGQRLTNISSSTCSIDFIAESERQDLDPYQPGNTELPKQLDTIRISTGAYCKDFILYQSYFETSNPSESEDYRLRLDSLEEIACDASVAVTPYRFEYNSRRLPNRLSNAIDHWGFYNGALFNDANDLNIPDTEIILSNGSSFSRGNSNRSPDDSFSDAAILEQINYPEGGFTHFDYEGHQYYNDQSTQSTSRIGIISGLSNCTIPDTSCCSNQDAMAVDSFSQAEIDEGRFSLAVTDVSASGAMTCNSMTTEIILTIFEDGSGTQIGSVGYNVNAGDDAYQEYDWDIFPLVAGTFYRIELEVDGAKGEFNLWQNTTITTTVGNEPVGGLRIQQITVHDGIDTARDIIKTYEYSSSIDPMRSSGVLYKPPKYGFSLGVIGPDAIYVALFSSTSITPLSDFDGYPIGYGRVVEKRNGNGQSIYNHFIESSPTNGDPNVPYPFVPDFATVRNTQLQAVEHLRENGAQVAQTTNTQDIGSAGYTFYDDVMFKIQEVPLPNFPSGVTGCAPLDVFKCYSMRTGQYLVGTVAETIDGVTTTRTYDYDDNLDHLAPTIERMTNSEGSEYKTTYFYPFDFAATPIYQEMVDSNIIAAPLRTTVEVTKDGNNYIIGGSDTQYSYFDSNGNPTATQSGNDDPYPHRLFSYKRTFDEDGNPLGGYFELEATVEKRFADGILGKSSYPEIAQTADWDLKDSLDYENGIMVAYTYGDHKRTRTLHPNTRMTASRTDIDGQPVFFNYDQLMRVDTILARPKSANPNPANTDDFNVVTTAEYVYPQMACDRAYTRTRIDYAPEPTGNSQFNFRETFAYVDGIGRLIQTIERQHSPDSLDVLIAQEYDNQGRISRVYEPYEISQNTGAFVDPIPLFAQQRYTETRYFNSPLNRMRGTTPTEWFESLMDYESNAANEVQNLETGGFYAADELTKQIARDPDGKRTITFTDKRARVVMTRRDSIGSPNFIETYRLYDVKDRPTKVVPPDATLADGNLVFSYLYNDDDQLIMQKIPDKDTIYMQYDDRELLTAMQDGVMRDSSRWLVSLLDDYGRTTQTGFYLDASSPNPNIPIINNGLLTETFYDGGFGVDAATEPIYYGRVRKTRTSILNGYLPSSSFIESTFSYDSFGRTTNRIGNNHLNLASSIAEQTFFQYDFADNLSTSTKKAISLFTSIN
ncbi:MAG: DUF6443 domain-containing protein [Bacteroidota bacterium]